MKKAKFKPQITRVKLNPEQAVLQCDCFSLGRLGSTGKGGTLTNICEYGVGSKLYRTGICILNAGGTVAAS